MLMVIDRMKGGEDDVNRDYVRHTRIVKNIPG